MTFVKRIVVSFLMLFRVQGHRRKTDVTGIPQEPELIIGAGSDIAQSAAVILTRIARGGTAHAIALIVADANSEDVLAVEYFDSKNSAFGSVLVDAFAFIQNHSVQRNRHIDLYIGHRLMREWFEEQVNPNLSPNDFGGGQSVIRRDGKAMLATYVAARVKTCASRSRLETTPAGVTSSVSPSPVVVATDASARSGHRGVGIAYVSDDGRWQQAFLPSTSNIAIGELEAIILALTIEPKYRKLEILTDCLNAVNWIYGRRDIPNHLIAVRVRRIRSELAARDITISWVRGHSGHPLNETADRLALAARRNGTANVSADVCEQIAENIIADLRTLHASAA